MKYKIIPVTVFQQNCTLFWCEKTRDVAIIDPGGEIDKILKELKTLMLNATKILLTHGHIDHIGGAMELAKILSIPIFGPQKEDEFLLNALPMQSKIFNFDPCIPFKPNHWLQENDNIVVGHEILKILHCPGHTPGHIVFFCQTEKLIQVGDVIFKKAIGRTDFYRSDERILIRSIKQKLLSLDDNITFIPGHGPISTIGEERKNKIFYI